MFNEEELKLWEEEQTLKAWERFDPVKKRRAFDPHKDRMFKARQRLTLKYFWGRENKHARRKIQTRFQMQMKENLYKEEFYRPVPHDYKTYGWETY